VIAVFAGCGGGSSDSSSSDSSSTGTTAKKTASTGDSGSKSESKSDSGSNSESDSSSESDESESGKSPPKRESFTIVKGTPNPPKVVVPPGPPPKNLVVKDIKVGTLNEVKPKDRLRVNYIGVNYKTGKPFEVNWGKKPLPFIFTWGVGEVIEGWEKGLKGMKVGGVRELIVPSKMAYDTGTLLYVIELLQNE